MHLIVGLGNPGKEYERTYHNIGFLALDEFAKTHGFPEFSVSKKYKSLITEGALEKISIILAKPQTFMNNSGISAKAAAKNYKLKTKNLIVIHDDIDLPLGSLKISFGSGSGGHKGVESIIAQLKTKDFARIRIGICPEGKKPANAENFVLRKISKQHSPILKKAIETSSLALETLLKDGLEKAMAQFNK